MIIHNQIPLTNEYSNASDEILSRSIKVARKKYMRKSKDYIFFNIEAQRKESASVETRHLELGECGATLYNFEHKAIFVLVFVLRVHHLLGSANSFSQKFSSNFRHFKYFVDVRIPTQPTSQFPLKFLTFTYSSIYCVVRRVFSATFSISPLIEYQFINLIVSQFVQLSLFSLSLLLSTSFSLTFRRHIIIAASSMATFSTMQ